jgi:hypothetical protein
MLVSGSQMAGRGFAAEPLPETAATAPGPAPGEATPGELDELVSPIALYPDLLLARILVASTFPSQIVEAWKWLQENPNLKGDEFAKAVNAQSWDPSVRSLSQFREVIKTMNDNLAWTSGLGEAYYNQPDDVMNAIQRLRDRAIKAGALKDTPQQKVEVEPASPQPGEQGAPQQIVVIQPAQQNTVYVPQYDSSSAYGAPVAAPAGYTAPAPAAGYTGTEMLTTGLVSFGLGMGLMALINEDDDDWDCGWDGSGGNNVNYNKNVYVNRGNDYPRSGGGGQQNRRGRQETREARRGERDRPTPYSGQGTRNPSSRPYNPANARPYRPGGAPGGNPGGAPVFPKASTLPANVAMGTGPRAMNRPSGVANRSGSAPRQGVGPGQSQGLRGYGANNPDRASRGGRNGAFGGAGPGGMAQAAGNRGRSSFGGGRSGGGRASGGGGRRGGGGGGGRSGGGRGRR